MGRIYPGIVCVAITRADCHTTERYGQLMSKSIYTYYKERLIEIGGKNKCLYLKNISKKNAYDIGRIFEGREDKVNELIKFLWSAGKDPLSLIPTRRPMSLSAISVCLRIRERTPKEQRVPRNT